MILDSGRFSISSDLKHKLVINMNTCVYEDLFSYPIRPRAMSNGFGIELFLIKMKKKATNYNNNPICRV